MQILWAIRYNPLRGGSSRQGPAIAGARNCRGQSAALTMRAPLWYNFVLCHQVFLRSAAKKTRLYHRRQPVAA
ncbi:MAG: hypothetical protein LBK44_06350 [Spirochaetales bacterium]|nr:hypothetical protein [Spirochaetales bacterium]